MRESKIYYREIQKSDYPALAKLISDTWNYEKFCSPKIAAKMGAIYLRGCLAEQNFTCVAEKDDVPVGVIMGKSKNSEIASIKHRAAQLPLILSMMLSGEAREVMKIFKEMHVLYEQLLKESGKAFDGELSFFAVKEDQRGTGIGKELFQRHLNEMKSHAVKNFYLYTDTSCNFGFYERQGMKRIGEKQGMFKLYSTNPIQVFLYEYCF